METEIQILSPLFCCTLCSWWLLQPFTDLGKEWRSWRQRGSGRLAGQRMAAEGRGTLEIAPSESSKGHPSAPSGDPLSHSMRMLSPPPQTRYPTLALGLQQVAREMLDGFYHCPAPLSQAHLLPARCCDKGFCPQPSRGDSNGIKASPALLPGATETTSTYCSTKSSSYNHKIQIFSLQKKN